jgi:hypothetical protein
MIVGMAVATTVPSRAATASAAMIPTAMTNCSGVIPMRRATAWWRRPGVESLAVGVTAVVSVVPVGVLDMADSLRFAPLASARTPAHARIDPWSEAKSGRSPVCGSAAPRAGDR